jgi:Holliday junction resolvasome RuvABC ATP-dependent DNA helicase subunit
VDGLEDQIANAIIQAEAKGDDRTSRTGNILIFGAHGSGKTTLAMNIAKAIARDKGNQTMKIAKIYAADLNRKDIAATVARIAGGTLIIEEAGDLEAGTIEQLTTAMEFRTDGLIVILEDEQQYIHELLMQHPRFTMKFTAQIYIPAYTAEELATFGQICANAQDFVLGEDAYEILRGKIETAQQSGTAVSITDVTEMVNRAIARSNKFFRKISMGKKRYDENDYVVLFPKDMK